MRVVLSQNVADLIAPSQQNPRSHTTKVRKEPALVPAPSSNALSAPPAHADVCRQSWVSAGIVMKKSAQAVKLPCIENFRENMPVRKAGTPHALRRNMWHL